MTGNNFVRPKNLHLTHLTFLYFILQMNKGKEIAIDTENGEGIYAKNSMKLGGVQVKSNFVLQQSLSDKKQRTV